jgi:hypothetical protein
MEKSRKTIDNAAGRLAALASQHLAKLSAAEQAKRLKALERVVAKIDDSPSKSSVPRGIPASPPACRERA